MTGDDFTKEVAKKKVPLSGTEQTNVVDFINKSPVIEIVPENTAMRDVIDTEYKPAVAELEAKIIADVPTKLTHVRVPTTPDGAGLIDPGGRVALLEAQQAQHQGRLHHPERRWRARRRERGPALGRLRDGYPAAVWQQDRRLQPQGQGRSGHPEYAVDYSIGLETGIAASSGAFPYVGHLSYTYDGKLAKGSRITKLELLDANGQWQPLDDEKVYRVGANTYIASGKDGYNGLLKREELPNKGDYVDSGVGENEMFMEYAESRGTLNPLPYATVTYYKP